jgi:hypothetical protein
MLPVAARRQVSTDNIDLDELYLLEPEPRCIDVLRPAWCQTVLSEDRARPSPRKSCNHNEQQHGVGKVQVSAFEHEVSA